MTSPQVPRSDDASIQPPHYEVMEGGTQQENVTSPEYGNIDDPENNLQHPANKPQKGPHWIRGDPRWISTSKYTAQAPSVVLVLFVLSLAEIVAGVLWLVQAAGDLTFQGVLQPLCIPCLSFFNTVPSGHLHLYAHANPPTMAIWFSGLISLLYLASSLLYTVSCTASSASPGVQHTECWRNFNGDPDDGGPRKSVWEAVVIMSWFSFVGYAVHAHMAWMVKKWMAARPKDENGIVLEDGFALDPVQKARREQEARDRWKKIVDL